ncbi:MAG: polysaccharide biosynthesis C-terminal domain-containing protein [Deltaproteobacteria bacterium]|nr:polysaccharide biosynthesis C-terminal domain-containing protein [Deltaproteobacteria bacterium]
MNYAFRLVIIIILPTAVGLIVLAEPIVNVLFQRGEFNYLATARTASALRWYASGLLFFGSLRVMVPAFYALKNSLVPALAALAALVANIISGLSFMGPTVSDAMPLITAWTRAFNPTGPMQHDGLALANTVSAFVNMVVLGVVLRRRVGRIGGRKIAKTALQSGLACLLMAGAAWLIASRFQFTESGADPVRIAGLFAAILAGGGVYFGALALLDRKQARNVWRLVTRRKGALPEEPV